MNVLVTGGHDYTDRERVYAVLDALRLGQGDLVVEGGAPGVDTFAREWCISRGIGWREFPAKWHLYGKKAGPIRNAEMLFEVNVDVCVAFPGNSGTADMVTRCRRHSVYVRAIHATDRTNDLMPRESWPLLPFG